MRGLLDDEESDFGGWLRKLTNLRLERMSKDDLYVSAAWGAVEAARSGTTCVGDASSAAFESMTALRDVGLRGTVFQESFGPDPNMARENVAILEDQLSRMRSHETSRVRAGVSPHAPYTVSAPQLRLISEFARAEEVPLMMHAAESAAEELLMHDGKGPFAAALAARGINWKTSGVSSIQYLRANGILDTRPLLAHCIRVDDADIESLAATETRIAHCPKSNAKLGHGRAPLRKFLAKGVIVGFGTDSVASNNSCDLLEEARFATLVARLEGSSPEMHPFLGATTALRTATAGGASALGLDGRTGELRSDLQADLTVVSLAGTHQLPCYDPAGTLLFASSGRDVILTVVAGREIFRNGRVTTVDEDDLCVRMKRLAKKLEHQE
jgi:5-methylthioadenosine/S-adenosylhomocysteine deaminase